MVPLGASIQVVYLISRFADQSDRVVEAWCTAKEAGFDAALLP